MGFFDDGRSLRPGLGTVRLKGHSYRRNAGNALSSNKAEQKQHGREPPCCFYEADQGRLDCVGRVLSMVPPDRGRTSTTRGANLGLPGLIVNLQ
jgi:hypothetical protein